MRIVAALAALLIGLPSARAEGEEGEEVEEARRLSRSVDRLVGVYYAPPDSGLRDAPSRLYQTLLHDPVTAALLESLVSQYRGGYVQVSLDAGATADLSTPGAVNAALDASYELPICRVVGVSASGIGGYEGGKTVAAWSLGGTLCLPLPANTVQVSYTRRDNVRTTLLARPVVLRDRRTDDLVDVMVRFYRWQSRGTQLDLAPFNLGVDISRSAEGDTFGAQTVDLDTAPVVWHRRGKGLAGANQVYRFFQFRGRFQGDDRATSNSDAFVANISPLVVEGVHLDDDVVAGLDLGWSVSSVRTAGREVVSRTDLQTTAWVAMSRKPLGAELRATHGLLPTFGGQLVLEDRLSARVELGDSRYALRVNGFVGRARVLRDVEMPENPGITVAGTGGDLAIAVKKRVHAIARLELARSLAPTVAGEPAHKQFDVRATVGLTTHFDKRW